MAISFACHSFSRYVRDLRLLSPVMGPALSNMANGVQTDTYGDALRSMTPHEMQVFHARMTSVVLKTLSLLVGSWNSFLLFGGSIGFVKSVIVLNPAIFSTLFLASFTIPLVVIAHDLWIVADNVSKKVPPNLIHKLPEAPSPYTRLPTRRDPNEDVTKTLDLISKTYSKAASMLSYACGKIFHPKRSWEELKEAVEDFQETTPYYLKGTWVLKPLHENGALKINEIAESLLFEEDDLKEIQKGILPGFDDQFMYGRSWSVCWPEYVLSAATLCDKIQKTTGPWLRTHVQPIIQRINAQLPAACPIENIAKVFLGCIGSFYVGLAAVTVLSPILLLTSMAISGVVYLVTWPIFATLSVVTTVVTTPIVVVGSALGTVGGYAAVPLWKIGAVAATVLSSSATYLAAGVAAIGTAQEQPYAL